jgi:hypothetical protein
LCDSASSQDEDAANGKRRKRSSIFFKKKKVKIVSLIKKVNLFKEAFSELFLLRSQEKDRSRRGPAVSGPSPVMIGSSASFNLSSSSSAASHFGMKSLTLPPNNKAGLLQVGQYYSQSNRLLPTSGLLPRKQNGNSPTSTTTKDFGSVLQHFLQLLIGELVACLGFLLSFFCLLPQL